MSIRFVLGTIVILFFSARCWQGRWFGGCCAALVSMAFLEHPDFPKSLFGIPGINLWNILIANVVASWLHFRGLEGLSWDMSKFLQRALLLFCAVMFVSFFRALMHPEKLVESTPTAVIGAYFIDCFKWLLPLLILYDGVRNKERCQQALCAVMAFYFLISLQVIHHLPLQSLVESGSDFRYRSSKILERTVGYNRDNMSTMLAGASWAAIALSAAFTDKRVKWALLGGGFINLLAQALTAGKTGYGAWLVVGVLLGLLRWRKLVVLLPALCFLILAVSPSIRESLFQGFGGSSGPIVQQDNMAEITSGRSVIWPAVIHQIGQSPLFGYGRDGFHASGVADYIAYQLDDSFPHPHNAYLEWLLDTGVIGMILTIPLYGFVIISSMKLFRQQNGLASAAGGITLSLLCGELVGAMGAQTFYPRESTVVMWASIGIMARVLKEIQGGQSEPFSDSGRDINSSPEELEIQPVAI